MLNDVAAMSIWADDALCHADWPTKK